MSLETPNVKSRVFSGLRNVLLPASSANSAPVRSAIMDVELEDDGSRRIVVLSERCARP